MIIIQTPLRISFFGGGTDFPGYFREEGGCVLSAAINKYIFVTIKERFDDKIRIGYTRTEIVDQLDEIQHELIREALRTSGLTRSVEIVTMGDLPAGSGLGSSGAVTVGALHAVYAQRNQPVTQQQLAEEACEIEVGRLKKPIGFQDQYIAAFGGLRWIEFPRNGPVVPHVVNIEPATLRRFNANLLLFFTGVTRKAESILAQQQENIPRRLPVLRALKGLAHQAREALCSGEIDEVGHLLHQSWQLKKQLADDISNTALEYAYQAAIDAGAYGGKITGAGGGGFLLLYCPPERQAAVRSAVSTFRELPFGFEPDGSKVIFHYRY